VALTPGANSTTPAKTIMVSKIFIPEPTPDTKVRGPNPNILTASSKQKTKVKSRLIASNSPLNVAHE
jgi:hypothetical protein